jgi:hypothetical protein
MNRTPVTLSRLLLIAGLIALCGQLCCTLAADADKRSQPAVSEEQQQARLKEKWRKPLEDARREFLSTNDRESADFIGKILDSLEQPGGLSPTALAGHARQMKQKTRDLVRRGASESAAALNWAQWSVLYEPGPGVDGPTRANPSSSSGSLRSDGLVLYLPFDTPPTNGVVYDESGAGNHGRVEGAQWVPEGRLGGAYQFRITNLTDRIVIPDSDSLDVQQVTVAAWINTPDTDGFWNRILDKDFRKGYDLCLGGDWRGKGSRGKLVFEVNGMGMHSDRPVGDGRWHHVAGTYDGKFKRLYVDGEPKQVKAERPGPITRNSWDLCVGNSTVDYGTGEFLGFDGLIDEVRVYNHALSNDEIKALATATQAGAGAAAPPAPEATAKPSAADRLKQAKELYSQGLITKEDYDKKVKEILDAL